MKALVIAASKHGSTLEIARAIGEELQADGLMVEVCEAHSAPSAAEYDAVVIGSGVYAGSWLSDALRYVDAQQAAWGARPVWLFSSGPLGAADAQPQNTDPGQLPELMRKTHARGHLAFAGRLHEDSLGWGERLIIKVVRAPYGDYRDWAAIRAWAREIAAALVAHPAGTST